MVIVHPARCDAFLMALPQEIMRMAQVIVLKRAHFFSIDNDIIDVHAKTIGAIGIAIYAVLARYANRKTGECWPAIARIQRTLNLGRSTVKRYLHRLETAGLITVEERLDEEGDHTSNRYTLLDPDPTAIAQRQEQAETPVLFNLSPATEGGGSATDLPSVPCDELGGFTPNPEPSDPQNQHRETTNDVPSQGQTNRQRTCLHPVTEVHRMADAMTICLNCFSILDTPVTSEGPCHGNDVAA
jgi:DNA-binding MarR family transcriptional regulator